MAKKVRNVNQNKKAKRLDVQALMAMDAAYGRTLDKKRILKIISKPALWFLSVGLLLFYNRGLFGIPFVFAAISLIFGALYGLYFILPKEIRQQYNDDAYRQRNEAINLMTQSILDENLKILDCLDAALENAQDEFQYDLKRLMAVLYHRDSDESIRNEFKHLIDKYPDDVIFGSFMEQMESAVFDGIQNRQVFVNLSDSHNKIFTIYDEFTHERKMAMQTLDRIKAFVVGLGYIVYYVGATMSTSTGSFSEGLPLYAKAFSYSWAAFIGVAIFALPLFLIQVRADKRYYDASVTVLK